MLNGHYYYYFFGLLFSFIAPFVCFFVGIATCTYIKFMLLEFSPAVQDINQVQK